MTRILEKDIRALNNLSHKETLQIRQNYEVIRLHNVFVLFKTNNKNKFIKTFNINELEILLNRISHG